MSKGHMLRALVNQRLAAAAEEIFALFERTILEYEEQLCRSIEENQRKQRLLDTVLLSPTAPLPPHRAAAARVHVPSEPSPPAPGPSPGPGPIENQDMMTETAQIKEETGEQSVKVEEELLLPVPDPEFGGVRVKTEEPSLLHQRQADHKEETREEDARSEPHFSETEARTERSSDTDNDDDWGAPFCSTSRTDGEVDEAHCGEVQTGEESTAARMPGLSPDRRTSASVSNGDRRKKHQCFICQKRFDSKIVLQIHVRVHTGEKPYSCPICKKAFAQKNNLNAHRIIHTGEKPYSCSLCKKTFGRRCTLKRHMKIHAAEKPLPSDAHENLRGYVWNY